MKTQYKILLGALLLLGAFFLVRQYILLQNTSLQIIGEKNIAVVRTPSGQLIGFGDASSQSARMIVAAMSPFGSSHEVIDIQSLSSQTEHKSPDFLIQKITPHITRGVFTNQTIWFFSHPQEEDFTQLKKSPLSFASDIWILQNNIFPDFFPPPNATLLHLGERKPSKKLETFARENTLPLISVSQTQGALLEYEEGNWEVKTRE